jgi:putative lipoprotein
MTCRITGWVVGGLAALVLAGCAGRTPPPSSAPSTATTAPEGPQEAAVSPAQEVQVTGSVFYSERIGLTPDAVLQVEVVEEGAQGPTLVGEQTLRAPGQVPLRFSVSVPAQRVRPEATYTVRARITDGARSFSTPQPVPVLTQGHPSTDVRVRVRVGG